ncbi:MAG: UDP-glucose/GDP-mannose dehydrogenase family protein, partial [Myxococcota bacterium]|nr:UDP-glucose/GDP-mannose dehydrogenase family protein [Myxococcota bacterium]
MAHTQKICVVGTGYVGLVAGVCMADLGFPVVCVDRDVDKIAVLNAGGVPIYEPGLESILRRNVRERRLRFTTDGAAAIANADVVYIAVGTPGLPDGSADISGVLAVADMIGRSATGPLVVVIKSTVPVGTADRVRASIAAVSDHEFDVVSNPEFLKEGAAIDDFMKPDRIVVGCRSDRAREVMGQLYAGLMRSGRPILYMDNRSAELTKYASNALLATKISFMNELSRLCELVGADVERVRRGVGADTRIGPRFLFAGVGYGGSCFPKDVKAL